MIIIIVTVKHIQKNTRNKVLESLSQWGGKLIEVPYTKSISTSKLLTKFKNDNTLFHKKEWSFNLNSKIVFKKKIDAILKKNLGKGNLLIVTSNSFRKNKIVKVIEKSKNNIFIFSSVKPNPTIEEIDHLSETYKSKNIKTIIAIGGGSVLDTAKTLSIIINNPNKKLLNDFFRKKKKFKFITKTKLIAIPTTSGSGAEVTPFATIWDKKNLYKYSFSLDNIVPNLVLLEPQLQVSQKKDLTLYSALDTISHALESLWNKNKTIISESFAFESLLLSNSSLLKAMNNPKNIEARSKLLIASNIAGLAISQTRTAIAHSISYPITLNFNVPHGLACSFTLATLLKKNMESTFFI